MEPPAKRPRLGISPFNNDQEDVDDDELNLQPEQVNALRDPGYQLERARSFAANKLKSAFERIFEKYEKDFTGVGDEINLETGELEVDNGHIRSLQFAELEGEDGDGDDDDDDDVDDDEDDDDVDDDEDDDDVDDDEDDDESIDEEERLLQGKDKKERRLSTAGENQNTALTSLVRPPGQPQPWSGMQFGMGGPPRISSMFGPPTPFGPFSTSHSMMGGMDTSVDPAWTAPQLPVVEKYVDPTWRAPELPPPKPPGPRFATVKKKLLPARSGNTDGDQDEDEDDLLMGVSTTPMTKPNGDVTVKKMKKLLPLHPAQGSSPGNPKISSKATPKSKEGAILTPKELSAKRKVAPKNSNKEDTLANASSKSDPNLKDCSKMKENQPIHSKPVPSKQVVAVKRKRSSEMLPSRCEQATETDLYVNHSTSDKTTAVAKPANQKLCVEIVVKKKIDKASYQIVSADSGPETDAARPAEGDKEAQGVGQPPVDDILENSNHTSEDMGQKKQTKRAATQKIFARNVIDSSFTFSDDDEPALPRARNIKHRSSPKERRRSTGHHDLPNVPPPQGTVAPEVVTTKGLSSTFDKDSEGTGRQNTLASKEKDHGMPENIEHREPVFEEIYTRNVINPGFTFSDEDEPALPKARVNGGINTAKDQGEYAAQDELLDDGDAALKNLEILATNLEESYKETEAVVTGNLEHQSTGEENSPPREQETLVVDFSGTSSKQAGENDTRVSTVDHVVPLAPAESSGVSPGPDANQERNEPPMDLDITTQSDFTFQIDGSEPTVTGPIDSAEPPRRLLQMKPRRKRKISTALTDESMASPTVAEVDKPSVTFITAPSKRFKRPKQAHPVEVPDLGGQPEQPVQTEPESVVKNDITLPEASQTLPAGDLVILESPQPPADAEAKTAAIDLTIPESPELIQPEFRSSLLGIIQEEAEDQAVRMHDDDADNDMDIGIDFDSPSDHPPTPLPDLPSPELGEELNVPETSPLPYSSPSKAVKAVKKIRKPRSKPLHPQPTTPVKNKGKQNQQQRQEKTTRTPHPPSSSGLSSRTKGILSLLSDEEDETDELSLTPGTRPGSRHRYYTPPNVRHSIDNDNNDDKIKHTSLTAPLQRMKLLSSTKKKGIVNNPKTPSRRRTLMSTVAVNNENQKPKGAVVPPSSVSSKMYFSADRRASISSASGAVVINSSGGTSSRGGVYRRGRRRSAAAVGGSRLAGHPTVPEFVDDSVVETPGGTKRRCGEDGFHCDRDFCFVCL